MKETIELETNRLLFRKMNIGDAEEMFENYCSDPLVSRYVTWDTHKSVEDTKEFVSSVEESYKNDYTFKWLVLLKETNEIIGSISVVHIKENNKVAEIGYCYGSKYWGNGYATESLKRIIEFLFEEVKVETVCARHMKANVASGKVMEKARLTYEGTLRNRKFDKVDKKLADVLYYSINRSEYFGEKND